MLRPSLTTMVFALNEEGNLENTINAILQAKNEVVNPATQKRAQLPTPEINLPFVTVTPREATGTPQSDSIREFAGFDILIVDDGSTDHTGAIAEELAKKRNFIKVVHNPRPSGIGYNFRTFGPKVQGDYVGWFPGDNETLIETIRETFAKIGDADIIIPYTFNPWVRRPFRRVLSSSYTVIFNTLFRLNLRYYNGTCFFKKELLKNVTMTTDGLAYMAEILIQLLKRGDVTYIEVPMFIRAREHGTTKVLKWKNVWLIGKTICSLFWRMYFTRKRQSAQTPLIHKNMTETSVEKNP